MAEKSKLWYFEQVDLFEMLCPHKVAGLAETHTFTHFKKDEFVYFPEQAADTIYLIAEGRIRIGSYTPDGKELTKAILGRGEIFGEMALVGEDIREDFAQAMDSKTIVCPMTIDEMESLMSNNQPLNLKIIKLIGYRLKKLERRLEGMVHKDARSRIVDFIKDMAQEKGKKVGYEMLVPTKLTHKDIANLTGTSRQTVTTILNDLREQNLITFDRRRILVRDMAKLA